MSFEDDDGEFGWFFRLIPFVAIPVFIAVLWWAPSLPKPPANTNVFGCYVATASPPILLDASGMHVKQLGFPAIPYHLEQLKTGIALTAEAPIRADKTQAGYRFAVNSRGIGLFMPFYRVENGQTYGVFEVSLLAGFQMLDSGGNFINYAPADPASCT